MSRRRQLYVLAAVVVTTALLRLWIVLNGRFDGLYGQDPYAYFSYAVGPLRSAVTSGEPLPPFHWPPGFPLLVMGMSFVVGRVPLAGQIVSFAGSVLLPFATFLLAEEVFHGIRNRGAQSEKEGGTAEVGRGRRKEDRESGDETDHAHLLFPRRRESMHGSGALTAAVQRVRRWDVVPLVAGILVACVGQLWQSSVVVMSDVAAVLFASLGMWWLARYGRVRRPLWLWLAAVAFGLGILTRWSNGLVALPAVGYALWVLTQRPWRVRLLHGGVALVLGAAALWPVLLPAIETVFGSGAAAEPTFTTDLAIYRWNPLFAFQRQFFTTDGHLTYRYPNGLYYLLGPAHLYYFTPLIALFLPVGMWQVWRRGTAASLWLVMGWVITVSGFLIGVAWQNFRFNLAQVPALAILAAVGAVEAWAWCERQRPQTGWWVRVIVGLGLVAMVVGGWQVTTQFVTRKQAQLGHALTTYATLEQSQNPRLIAFDLTLTLQQYSYSDMDVYEIFYLTPDDIVELMDSGRDTFLLLPVNNIETQWVDRPPHDNFVFLRDEFGLDVVEEIGPYTLFRVVR